MDLSRAILWQLKCRKHRQMLELQQLMQEVRTGGESRLREHLAQPLSLSSRLRFQKYLAEFVRLRAWRK